MTEVSHRKKFKWIHKKGRHVKKVESKRKVIKFVSKQDLRRRKYLIKKRKNLISSFFKDKFIIKGKFKNSIIRNYVYLKWRNNLLVLRNELRCIKLEEDNKLLVEELIYLESEYTILNSYIGFILEAELNKKILYKFFINLVSLNAYSKSKELFYIVCLISIYVYGNFSLLINILNKENIVKVNIEVPRLAEYTLNTKHFYNFKVI